MSSVCLVGGSFSIFAVTWLVVVSRWNKERWTWTVEQTEIVARYVHYTALHDRGEKLMSQPNTSSDEIQKMLSTLEDVWNKLNDCWDNHKQMLTQLYDLRVCIWQKKQMFFLVDRSIRAHSWSLLKTRRGFSKLRVNSGMRIGPTGGLSARR